MCVCVKLLVHAFCFVHTFSTQKRIGVIYGMIMPYNSGNASQMSL